MEKKISENPDNKNEALVEPKTLPKPEDYQSFVYRMQSAGLTAQLRCVNGNVYDLHLDRDNLPTNINKLYQFSNTTPVIEWIGDPYAVCFVGDPFLTSKIETGFDPEDMKPYKNISPELLNNLGINLRILYYSAENQCFACVRADAYN